jgi:hypothetical protein
VEHGYYIGVEYQQDTGRNYNEESVVFAEWVNPGNTGPIIGVIDGVNGDFLLANGANNPIMTGTLKVYRMQPLATAWGLLTEGAAADYTFNAWAGTFHMNTAPAIGTQLAVTYDYYENLGAGDGVNKVFSVYHHPPGYGEVINGTLGVYLADWTTGAVAATSAYTFDPMSGEVTLTTAPTPNQEVLARYSFYDVIGDRYNSSDPPGRTFVVYSQAQADAMYAHLAVDELWDVTDEYLMAFEVDGGVDNIYISNYDDYAMVIGSDTTKALAAAWAADDEAWDRYVAGDFAGAQAQWDIAKVKLQEALDTQSALIGGIEDGVTGLLTGASSWFDAQAAKSDAEAAGATALVEAQKAQVQAEANRANRYGTFFILLGVGVLLVGVGGLLWGCSRIMGARKANQ